MQLQSIWRVAAERRLKNFLGITFEGSELGISGAKKVVEWAQEEGVGFIGILGAQSDLGSRVANVTAGLTDEKWETGGA